MKRLILFISLSLLLSILVMTSCQKIDDLAIDDTKELSQPISMKLFDEEVLSSKSLIGSTDGTPEFNQFSITDSISLADAFLTIDLRRLDRRIAETSYTFFPKEDSVLIDGVINIYQSFNSSFGRITYNTLQGHNAKLKYKFENGAFLVDVSKYDLGKDWVTVGYGDQDKFSIYVNYKYVYYRRYSSTDMHLVEFVNPSPNMPEQDETWAKLFFNFIPEWTFEDSHFRSFSMLNLLKYSQIMEELKRYDFKSINKEDNFLSSDRGPSVVTIE